MAVGKIATLAAIVGIVGGGIAIYKALTTDRAEEAAAAAFIQVTDASGNSGHLNIAGGVVTTLTVKVRNLGKRDAVEIGAWVDSGPGIKSISGSDRITPGAVPEVLEPRQDYTFEFMLRGTPTTIMKAREDPNRVETRLNLTAHYEFTGIVQWRDRATGKSGLTKWCFGGTKLQNSLKTQRFQIRAQHRGTQTSSPPIYLAPCKKLSRPPVAAQSAKP